MQQQCRRNVFEHTVRPLFLVAYSYPFFFPHTRLSPIPLKNKSMNKVLNFPVDTFLYLITILPLFITRQHTVHNGSLRTADEIETPVGQYDLLYLNVPIKNFKRKPCTKCLEFTNNFGIAPSARFRIYRYSLPLNSVI